MAATIRYETHRGPAVLHLGNGKVLVQEFTHITVTDFRETPFGSVNFGNVTIIGPNNKVVPENEL